MQKKTHIHWQKLARQTWKIARTCPRRVGVFPTITKSSHALSPDSCLIRIILTQNNDLSVQANIKTKTRNKKEYKKMKQRRRVLARSGDLPGPANKSHSDLAKERGTQWAHIEIGGLVNQHWLRMMLLKKTVRMLWRERGASGCTSK